MPLVAEWYRYRIVAGFVTSLSPVSLKSHHVPRSLHMKIQRASDCRKASNKSIGAFSALHALYSRLTAGDSDLLERNTSDRPSRIWTIMPQMSEHGFL
ncbi:hypothetical protein TNCV_1724581 [Trichonephila clavipes]|nr:hypothetical protein TNCV_1724581 [Trichonephila clavipes]